MHARPAQDVHYFLVASSGKSVVSTPGSTESRAWLDTEVQEPKGWRSCDFLAPSEDHALVLPLWKNSAQLQPQRHRTLVICPR